MRQEGVYPQIHFFKPALALSALVHAAVLVPMDWNSPNVNIQPGIASLSLELEEETPPDQAKPLSNSKAAPLTAKVSDDRVVIQASSSADPSPESGKDTRVIKQIVAVASEGAIQEARPDMAQNRAPEYPREAREKGWEGMVILKVHVQKNGIVSGLEIERSSGHPVLDQSAFKAVKTWRFLPSRIGPITFDSWIRVPLQFVLKGEAKSS